MARKTIEERIAELRVKQVRQELHTRTRALLDDIVTKMHARDYDAAHAAAVAVVTGLEGLRDPRAIAALEGKS